MTRILAGGLGAILLISGLLLYWHGMADVPLDLPEPPPEEPAKPPEDVLPEADISGLKGPTPPEATELTREQRRFARYDRNSDRLITRTEMLSSRTKAFKKLDKDGNNLLTFEEWAVATSDKFAKADRNGNGELNPAEFATTKPKRKKKPACRC